MAQLIESFGSGFETDHRAVFADPLDNLILLSVVSHELRNGVRCLGDALALGQTFIHYYIQSSHSDTSSGSNSALSFRNVR